MKIVRKPPAAALRPEQIKWDLRQRLALLEATLLWEGRATTQALTRLFGISRGQASKDFALYQQIAPDNLAYDLNRKAYVAQEGFAPRFMRGTAEEFLQLVEAGVALGPSVALPIVPLTRGVEWERAPARKLDLGVLRIVHGAIREGRQLDVRYQSMTREPREIRIEPHTLVHSGFRWHVRAYSHEHGAFRDFVLARFVSEPRLAAEPARHGIEQDADWQTWESLRIVPNPNLGTAQQAAIADDFGMEDGALVIEVRRALALYYRRLLGVDGADGDGAQARSRLVVEAAVADPGGQTG
jgi:predicted DNA-binding transcriptional regulator YafY